MTIYLISLLAGFLGGLRAFIPLALVSWLAYFEWIGTPDSWLRYFANPWTVGILTILALVELVTDQLPSTPSRKAPVQFGARIISGAISGAAIGTTSGKIIAGIIAGIIGAVLGTFFGHFFRTALASKLGNDHPAALIEDALAFALVLLIMFGLSV